MELIYSDKFEYHHKDKRGLHIKTTFQLRFPNKNEIMWYRCSGDSKYQVYLLTPSLKIIKFTKENFDPIKGYSWYELDKLIENCKDEDEFMDKLMINGL